MARRRFRRNAEVGEEVASLMLEALCDPWRAPERALRLMAKGGWSSDEQELLLSIVMPWWENLSTEQLLVEIGRMTKGDLVAQRRADEVCAELLETFFPLPFFASPGDRERQEEFSELAKCVGFFERHESSWRAKQFVEDAAYLLARATTEDAHALAHGDGCGCLKLTNLDVAVNKVDLRFADFVRSRYPHPPMGARR